MSPKIGGEGVDQDLIRGSFYRAGAFDSLKEKYNGLATFMAIPYEVRIMVTKEKLKQILIQREKRHINDLDLISSAVLVPVYQKAGQCHVLFIKRTDTVENHKGQISFPGGKKEHSDPDFLTTALREGHEEIGLRPDEVEVLGELDDERTIGSRFIIHPFLAAIPYPYEFELSTAEVDKLVEVPFSVLLDESNFEEGRAIDNGGEMIPAYFYHSGDDVIWGATARILKKLLDMVRNHS